MPVVLLRFKQKYKSNVEFFIDDTVWHYLETYESIA